MAACTARAWCHVQGVDEGFAKNVCNIFSWCGFSTICYSYTHVRMVVSALAIMFEPLTLCSLRCFPPL